MIELPSHRLKQAKRALRREVLAARDALPPDDRRAWSEAVAARFLALPELADSRTVMAFWSFGSEVDTALLLEGLLDEGRTTAMPRVEGVEVVPVSYGPGDEIRQTSFGAFEPVAGRVLDVTELDLVIVPGVAFDGAGRRIGYGGGFYDRLLPRLRARVPAVAVAFSIQLVPEVPAGGMDRRVDAIVTEREVIRCR
jgi:5-formyltetrahydrofolate cyclo-ligase